MAVILDDGFETGDFSAWYDRSDIYGGPAPTIISNDKFSGFYSANINNLNGGTWIRHWESAEPNVIVVRAYVKITANADSYLAEHIINIQDPALVRSSGIKLETLAPGVFTFWANIYDGVSTVWASKSPTLSLGVWYRIEMKLDVSAAVAKLTWGYAVGNAALTIVDTDFTGGNAWPAGTTLASILFGSYSAGTLSFNYDAIKIANSASDYPIGIEPTVTLDSIFPDADIVTTGWSTAPLFSKVNDTSDATVIQATAV